MTRKNLLLTAILLAVANRAHAGDNSHPEVLVHVLDAFPAIGPPQILLQGEETATKILDSAGVRLRWDNVQSSSRKKSQANGCGTDGPVQTIVIRFAPSLPRDHNPHALAEAHPYAQDDAGVTVFYDRVLPIFSWYPRSEGRILGHVLAHEVGHMLLGVVSHSETGLMKSEWFNEDYRWMVLRNINFSPGDVRSIQSNLARICARASNILVASANT